MRLALSYKSAGKGTADTSFLKRHKKALSCYGSTGKGLSICGNPESLQIQAVLIKQEIIETYGEYPLFIATWHDMVFYHDNFFK